MGVNVCLSVSLLLLAALHAGRCSSHCRPSACGCEDQEAGLTVDLAALNLELTTQFSTLVMEDNMTFFIQLCGFPDNLPGNCSNTLVCAYDGQNYTSFGYVSSLSYDVTMATGQWRVVMNALGDDGRNLSVCISPGNTTTLEFVLSDSALTLNVGATTSVVNLLSTATPEPPSQTPGTSPTGTPNSPSSSSSALPSNTAPQTTQATPTATSTVIPPLSSTVPVSSTSSAATTSLQPTFTPSTPLPPSSSRPTSTPSSISSVMPFPSSSPSLPPPSTSLSSVMPPPLDSSSFSGVMPLPSSPISRPTNNTTLPPRTSSSSSSPTPSPTPCPSCSCTTKVALAVGIAVPLTAIVTFFITLSFCLCCQKAKKKRSYIRLAPTVYFDEEDQD